jgi:hypothetical protein
MSEARTAMSAEQRSWASLVSRGSDSPSRQDRSGPRRFLTAQSASASDRKQSGKITHSKTS